MCQKPDREGGPYSQALVIKKSWAQRFVEPTDTSVALAYARASDTHAIAPGSVTLLQRHCFASSQLVR